MFSVLSVFAYETIIINYPDGEFWEKAYYKKKGNEALLQYVPVYQSSDDWTRSIVIHSYKYPTSTMRVFVNNNLQKLQKANPTAKYKTIKFRDTDAMFTRCTEDYKEVKGQCEFFRLTNAHGGFVTIHYMNRDKQDFKNNYTLWQEIIRTAKLYNSYWRDERTFDKSQYFELW
jgi:hypothetical protein